MLVGLFEKIWSMSVVGCYIILVVMLVRFLLQKCERKYSYLLWFVVFLNLCLPITIQGAFSLLPRAMFTWTQVKQEEVQDIYSLSFPMEDSSIFEGKQEEQQRKPSGERELAEIFSGQSDASKGVVNTAVSEIQQPKVFWQQRVSYLWLVVVLLLWGISIIKCVKLNRSLRECRDTGFWLEKGIVVAKDLEAPFLWGVRRPIIYLPETMEEIERNYIIAHERHHRKRFDHISKLIVFVVVTLHWFNPLVWAAYALFVRDMEISCDEAVLRHSKQDIKKQYASSLLKYAARQNGFVFTPLTFGEPSLKSRIRNVLGYRKQGLLLTIVSVMVVCFTACGLLTRPMEKTETEKHTVSSETVEEGYGESVTSSMENEKAGEMDFPEADITNTTLIQQLVDEEPEWVKTLLSICEENHGNARDFGWENSVLPVFADMTGEEEAVYGDNGELCADNDYMLECWMNLPDGTALKELHFDLQQEMNNHAWVKAFVSGVFYHRGQVFIVLPAGGTGEGLMIVNFSPNAPQDYQIHSYEGISAWFGEIVMIGEDICVHGANGSYPWRINVEGWEITSTAKEFAETQKRVEAYRKALKKEEAEQLSLQWFYASGRIEDVEIYTGYLGEDVGSERAIIYVAFQERECVGCILMGTETGEIEYLSVKPSASTIHSEK